MYKRVLKLNNHRCPERTPYPLCADASDRFSGAFNVSSEISLHDTSRCLFIKEPDFGNA
jgi:hypothetical protein